MTMQDICPCPNMDCPNHGYCDRCTSRHLRNGSLNYCGLHTFLPTLRDAIESEPESLTAEKLSEVLEKTAKVHRALMEKHGLTEETRQNLLKRVAGYSDY